MAWAPRAFFSAFQQAKEKLLAASAQPLNQRSVEPSIKIRNEFAYVEVGRADTANGPLGGMTELGTATRDED